MNPGALAPPHTPNRREGPARLTPLADSSRPGPRAFPMRVRATPPRLTANRPQASSPPFPPYGDSRGRRDHGCDQDGLRQPARSEPDGDATAASPRSTAISNDMLNERRRSVPMIWMRSAREQNSRSKPRLPGCRPGRRWSTQAVGSGRTERSCPAACQEDAEAARLSQGVLLATGQLPGGAERATGIRARCCGCFIPTVLGMAWCGSDRIGSDLDRGRVS